MNYKKLHLFLVLFFIANSGYGQLIHKRFEQYSSEDGLSDNTITSIVQDHKHYIWIGTQNGLNRFNGYEFINYKFDYSDTFSISNNTIDYLFEDSKNRLWVGTFNGLNQYDYDHDYFLNKNNSLYYRDSRLNTNITSIVEDRKGRIWYATSWMGAYIFDGKKILKEFNSKTYTTEYMISDNITSLAVDDSGMIWVGSGKGLMSIDPETYKITPYLQNLPLNGKSIQTMLIDEHTLWIGTSVGLIAFDIRNKSHQYYFYNEQTPFDLLKHRSINQIEKENDHQYWLSTDNHGIILFDVNGDVFEYNSSLNYNLSSDHITTIFIDRNKNLWAGTQSGGLNYSNKVTNMFSNYLTNGMSAAGLKEGAVTCFAEDAMNRIWIGIRGGGITLFDESKKEFETYLPSDQLQLLEFDQIIDIEISKNGNLLYLATFFGDILTFNLSTKLFSRIENLSNTFKDVELSFLTLDINNNLWIGSSRGLSKFNIKKNTTEHFFDQKAISSGLLNQSVTSFLEFDEYILIGTYDGLYSYRKKEKTFTRFTTEFGEDFLSGNVITALSKGSKEDIWICTGNGVYRYLIKEKSFRHYEKKDGLPSNVISSLEIDRNEKVWISTDNGLCTFDSSFKKIDQVYNKADGLHENDFFMRSSFKRSKGDLFFGGNEGLTIVFPVLNNHLEDSLSIHFSDLMVMHERVRLDSGSILKKHIDETDTLILDYTKSIISLKYTALNFTNPEKTVYAYKLLPFDDDWHYVGKNRLAIYTNLDPGTYSFLIKTSEGNEKWYLRKKPLTIVITPPFWETWWFRITIVLILIILTYVIFMLRTRAIREKNRLLEQKVRERTSQIEHQKTEIEQQKTEIEDSIEVGRLIQMTVLPTQGKIKEVLGDAFVWYKPKDIVSGDFYWYYQTPEHTYFAAADCTGHGVAGAFLTLIGHSHLNEILASSEKTLLPAEILDELNRRMIESLKQKSKESQIKDGMDITLCMINKERTHLQYAGAVNGIYHIDKQKTISRHKVDFFSIGIPIRGEVRPFTNHSIELDKGDLVYIYSDGIIDQFGGENGDEKFKSSRYKQLLIKISDLPVEEQIKEIDLTITQWMGSIEQTDDMVLIGFKA